MTDSSSIVNIISKTKPTEIYNLAAQSHVQVSFEEPEYTANADGLGVLRILEAIRALNLEKHTKFYQASTSELFGKVLEIPQSEKTPFYPRSPYGVAKLYAYWITVNYREAYNIFACNGILFNHESPLRGETFVTRKITMALARIKLGSSEILKLGNLNALRDWGHAKDYVRMQWMMLQQDKPDDFVISTGIQFSVRDFVNKTCEALEINISWEGEGQDEKGYDETGRCIVEVDPKYFRPAEVETLLGDFSKAKDILKWEPSISFEDLVYEMAESDLEIASLNKSNNFIIKKFHRKDL